RRLTGPIGRRILLSLALAAAWLRWAVLPPWPLREWTTASLQPAGWLLSPDRTQIVCATVRTIYVGRGSMIDTQYGPVRLWDLTTGRERLTAGANQPTFLPITLRFAPDGSWLLLTRRLERPDEVALQLWDTATGRERWSTPIVSDPGWG